MTLPRRDPYLWIHLAGLATVPIWLDLCLAGLAVGDPVVPPWLELATLAGVGTAPILWMQWQRPFYIFSVLILAVRPDTLSEDRRRLLTLHRSWLSRGLVVLSAIALFCLLVGLYRLAPLAAAVTPFAGQPRAVGWLICAIAFLLANLFVQVPAIVLSLLLTPAGRVLKTPPYETQAILQTFTVTGLRVRQILPDWSGPEGEKAGATDPASPDDPLAVPTEETWDQAPAAVTIGPSDAVAIASPTPVAMTHPDVLVTAEEREATGTISGHLEGGCPEFEEARVAESTWTGGEPSVGEPVGHSPTMSVPATPESLLTGFEEPLSPTNSSVALALAHPDGELLPVTVGGTDGVAAASLSTELSTVEAVASLDDIVVEAAMADTANQDEDGLVSGPSAAANAAWQSDK